MTEKESTANDLTSGLIESTSDKLSGVLNGSDNEVKKRGRGRPRKDGSSPKPKTQSQKKREQQEAEENAQMVAMILRNVFSDSEPSNEPVKWTMPEEKIQFLSGLWGNAMQANNIEFSSPKIMLVIAGLATAGELFQRREYFQFGITAKMKAGWLWLKDKFRNKKSK